MTEEEIRTAVVEIIKDKNRVSGGNNGTYLVEFRDRTGAEIKALKKVLTALYKEKKIRISDGSQGKLILLKKKP